MSVVRRLAALTLGLALGLATAQHAFAQESPPPSGSAMAKVTKGMPSEQVQEVLGAPTSTNSYPTGKGWIPVLRLVGRRLLPDRLHLQGQGQGDLQPEALLVAPQGHPRLLRPQGRRLLVARIGVIGGRSHAPRSPSAAHLEGSPCSRSGQERAEGCPNRAQTAPPVARGLLSPLASRSLARRRGIDGDGEKALEVDGTRGGGRRRARDGGRGGGPGRGADARHRRHRLGAHRLGAGPDDDAAGPRALLRRPRAREERAHVFMQCFVSAGVVGVLWILVGYSLAFGDRQRLHRRPLEGRPRGRDDRLGDRELRVAAAQHPRVRLRHVPGDVRDHHARR